jgi:hypothetical protein
MSLSATVGLERFGETRSSEPSAQRQTMAGGSQGNVVVVSPDTHFIAGLDAQFVAQFLWDHDVSLRTNPVRHTAKYDRQRPEPTALPRRTTAVRARCRPDGREQSADSVGRAAPAQVPMVDEAFEHRDQRSLVRSRFTK